MFQQIDNPSEMTADERLTELARLLAASILRLSSCSSSENQASNSHDENLAGNCLAPRGATPLTVLGG